MDRGIGTVRGLTNLFLTNFLSKLCWPVSSSIAARDGLAGALDGFTGVLLGLILDGYTGALLGFILLSVLGASSISSSLGRLEGGGFTTSVIFFFFPVPPGPPPGPLLSESLICTGAADFAFAWDGATIAELALVADGPGGGPGGGWLPPPPVKARALSRIPGCTG